MSSSPYFLSSSQWGRGLQVVTTGSSVAPEPGQSHCIFTWHRSVTNQRPVFCHLTNQRAQGQWAAAKEYLQPAFKLPEIFISRNLRFVLNKVTVDPYGYSMGGGGGGETHLAWRYCIKLPATLFLSNQKHKSKPMYCNSLTFRSQEARRVWRLPHQDPLRHADSTDHVLGWGGCVLWHHVQVTTTTITTTTMIIMLMITGASTSR